MLMSNYTNMLQANTFNETEQQSMRWTLTTIEQAAAPNTSLNKCL